VNPSHQWQRRTNIWHEVTSLAQRQSDPEQRGTVVLTGRT
jgi:hypothetical protein